MVPTSDLIRPLHNPSTVMQEALGGNMYGVKSNSGMNAELNQSVRANNLGASN